MFCDAVLTRSEFETAYKEGFPQTARLLVSKGAPIAVAEECAQAGWSRGWERRRQLRKSSAVLPWVNSIAVNIFKQSLKARRVQVQLDANLPYRRDRQLAAIDVEFLLNCCRECDRCLLEKYYLEERSTHEIARELNITKTAVRVRLLRTRNFLRSVLADRGGMQRHSQPAHFSIAA